VLKLFLASLLLAAMPAFAQLESHTLTISATRQIDLQPDQALFGPNGQFQRGRWLGSDRGRAVRV